MPGCRIALRVDREVRSPDGALVSHDVRYFIASLDPEQVSADDLLRYVRSHWQIENNLHFTKDRWWDEDRHYTRRPGLADCLTAINNAALSVHSLRSDPGIPLRAAADHIAWKPAHGLELLTT